MYTKKLSAAGCQKGVKDFVWGFVVWPPSVCMCVVRVPSAPPKAMRKDLLCANGPQTKVCQSKIRESSVCKDGEC